ncbi:MAG: PASTA domain-containing protein, partial [Succiniclasticum sp.]
DKPQYAMLVVLDNPRGAFYGSQVSAPIFRDTLQQILVAKGIQPSDSTALPSFEGKDTGDRSVPSLTPSGSNWILPSFQGLDSRTIAKILQTGRLVLEPYGSGTAYQQAPAPGSEVAPGSKVEVWFH